MGTGAPVADRPNLDTLLEVANAAGRSDAAGVPGIGKYGSQGQSFNRGWQAMIRQWKRRSRELQTKATTRATIDAQPSNS